MHFPHLPIPQVRFFIDSQPVYSAGESDKQYMHKDKPYMHEDIPYMYDII